jgi:hypothetical protein
MDWTNLALEIYPTKENSRKWYVDIRIKEDENFSIV